LAAGKEPALDVRIARDPSTGAPLKWKPRGVGAAPRLTKFLLPQSQVIRYATFGVFRAVFRAEALGILLVNVNDYIGERGEILFASLITKWCGGEPWFTEVLFLGAKAEARDFSVSLVSPDSGIATFFVQVKATTTGYSGSGSKAKLKVKVDKDDVEKLKTVPGPAFVIGIDIQNETGFILGITDKSKSISGIPVSNKLNCRAIKKLWDEVNDYWKAKNMTRTSSKFSS
jgi:hypothetical protein